MNKLATNNPKRFSLVTVLTQVLVLLLAICSSSVLANSKATNFDGLWNLEGYGMIAEIKNKKITLYEYTSISCLKGQSLNLETDNGNMYLFDYQLQAGETEDSRIFRHLLGYKIQATGLNSLPNGCAKEPKESTAVDNFEIFWHTFNEHYAFFELHAVDWQEQYDTYRPQVDETTSEEELFAILSKMLEPLKDGHISLYGEVAGKETDYSPGTFPTWFEDFPTIRTVLLDKYLQLEPTFFAKRRMLVSELSENITYLNILSMADYYNPQFWQSYSFLRDQQVLVETLDEIFSLINDPKYDSLVLDIRFNGGGYDSFSAEIASRFADKIRSMYSKSYWYQDSLANLQAVTIQENNTTNFDKPIILLTSGVTASAAEIFTLMMRDYPNVTVIGEPTAGEFSDVMERTLPNGFGFGLSNERYLTTDGQNFEKVGIPPDEEILIDIQDFESGQDPILDRAIEILNSQ